MAYFKDFWAKTASENEPRVPKGFTEKVTFNGLNSFTPANASLRLFLDEGTIIQEGDKYMNVTTVTYFTVSSDDEFVGKAYSKSIGMPFWRIFWGRVKT